MRRVLGILCLLLATGFAHASSSEDADAAWVPGQPWPAHWGTLVYPWEEGWNRIMLSFVHKVYVPGEVASTVLKDIPYALQKDAAVEFCMFKKGVFKFAGMCRAALVDPEVVGTLQEGDIVAMFHPKGGSTAWGYSPGNDGNAPFRIFQKVASETEANDLGCWVNHAFIIHNPVAPACLQRVDVGRAARLLARDFGPNSAAGNVEAAVSPPARDSTPLGGAADSQAQ